MNEMVQTDEQTVDYVEGRGDSFAQRVGSYRSLSKADSCWVVKGGEAILDQQEEGELAFHANLKGEEIVKLPKDTPIHAGVYSFKDQDGPLTSNYETVGDLLDLAKGIVNDLKDDPEIAKVLSPVSEKVINSLAIELFEDADWASLSTTADEICNDIAECFYAGDYDAYPELFLSNKEVDFNTEQMQKYRDKAERKNLKMKEENTMTYYYEKIYPASATQAKQTIEHMSEEELVSDVLDRLENSLLDEQLVDGTWYTAEDLAQLRKDQAIISDPNLSFESKFSAIKDAYSWDDQLAIRVQDQKDLIPEKTVEFF